MAGRESTRLGIAFAAMAACLAGAAAARAQDSGDITVEIGDCVNLASPEERRACYAARVDAAVQERERSAAAAEGRSSSSGDETVRLQGAPHAPSAAPSDIVATIAALRETVPNSYVITLDNGQTWRQMRPKWFPLRVGQEVRIYPSSWGDAFRLSAHGLSGFLQVERVH